MGQWSRRAGRAMPPEQAERGAFTVLARPPVLAVRPTPRHAARTLLDPKFSRALDLRLRRLQQRETQQARPQPRQHTSNPELARSPHGLPRAMSRSQPRLNVAGAEPAPPAPAPAKRISPTAKPETERPRFVTTVRAGRFLLPPPEIASLLGLDSLYPPQEREKLVYSYASKPKAVPRARAEPVRRSPRAPQACQPGPPARQPRAPGAPAGLLGGVRSLAAGVAGMAHMLDQPHNGSVSAPYANVMHDKRVVRGSTFASHALAAGDGLESAAARAARTRRRALARRAAAARLRPGTPPPAPGRRHHPIQTERYLEELFDKGVELEVGVQTDLFVDRPATPLYVPAKTGADAATQIYPGELFDFELEVQPVLEALVGKTTEQALAEVAHEEELGALREQQRRYCELRDAERAERARLAAQHARLHDEKERRVAEARVARDAAIEARERAAAATLVQGYVAELLPSVLAGLRDQGYLVERAQRGVEEDLMPWLVQEVSLEIEAIVTSRDVITEIVREVVETRAALHAAAGERAAVYDPPPDSITPPSELDGEGEHEPMEAEEK